MLVKVTYTCKLCNLKDHPVLVRALIPTASDYYQWQRLVIRKCFESHGHIAIANAKDLDTLCTAEGLDIKIPDEYKQYYLVEGSDKLETKHTLDPYMENE